MRSLSLPFLIQRAAQVNPDLESALARIRAADAQVEETVSAFFPKLQLGQQYNVTDNPVQAFMHRLNQARFNLQQNFNDPNSIDDFQTQLLARYPIFTGGQRLAASRSARARAEAERQALAAVRNELTYRVARAYYQLLEAQRFVTVRQQSVQQIGYHLDIVKTRRRAGTAVESDVLSVRVRLAEARESLISARSAHQLGWALLDNVVGEKVERRPLPQQAPELPWSVTVDRIEAAVATAQSRRPEVTESNRRQEAASQQVDVAKAGRWPTIDFLVSYDVHTGDFSGSDDSYMAGVAISLDLFDGGQTRSKIARARARYNELRSRHRRLMLDIELAVRRAFLRLDEARQRLEVTAQAVRYAEASLREIEVRYAAEVATITELIDAQVALSEARVRQVAAEANVQIARAELQRAVGRLTLVPPSESPSD